MRFLKPLLQAFLCIFLTAKTVAQAQTFPTQRVTLVVGLAPGGSQDIIARLIAPVLQQRFQQPVLVENRPGAGTLVGAAYVARSNPDGYTLLVSGNTVGLAKLFVKDVPFESEDLRPLAQLVAAPYVIVVHPSVPAKTLQQFIAYAKQRPKALNFASIASTAWDLDYAVFMQRAGIDMTNVSYQGAGPGGLALLKNEVQFFFGVAGAVGPQIDDGRLVALAVTSPQRYERYPNLPTVRESGVDWDTTIHFGTYVPSKTPGDVVEKLGAAIAAAVHEPTVAARFREMGFVPPANPQQWGELLQAEAKVYMETARRLGVRPQ